MSEVDLRTNCPFCRIDINDPEHNHVNCLHESYTMLIRARERMDSLENRFRNIETRDPETTATEAPPPANPPTATVEPPVNRLRYIYFRLKWKFYDSIEKGWIWSLLVSLALLRFILYGIN